MAKKCEILQSNTTKPKKKVKVGWTEAETHRPLPFNDPSSMYPVRLQGPWPHSLYLRGTNEAMNLVTDWHSDNCLEVRFSQRHQCNKGCPCSMLLSLKLREDQTMISLGLLRDGIPGSTNCSGSKQTTLFIITQLPPSLNSILLWNTGLWRFEI